MPAHLHYDATGDVVIDDASEPQTREVTFYGFDQTGRPLWVDSAI